MNFLKFMVLEDRIVFDAALAAIIADTVNDHSASDAYLVSRTASLPIIYVDSVHGLDTNTGNNGLLWGGAVKTIQKALQIAAASSGADQIWITQGNYSNTATYAIPDGVVIYGGFSDTHTQASPNARTFGANTTFLLDSGSAVSHVVSLTGATVVIDGVTMQNALSNTASTDGAAIFSTAGSNLLLYKDTFQNNVSTNRGGAIYSDASQLAVFSSTFYANSAPNQGGAIYVSNAVVDAYSASLGNSAVTLSYDNFGSVDVLGNVVAANKNSVTGSGSLGGAVFILNGPSVSMDHSSFYGNTAIGGGGAVYAQDASTLTLKVDTSIFYKNTTNDTTNQGGGAIRAINIGDLTVTGSTFTSNQSRIGGGIFVERNSGVGGKVTLTGNTFDSNIGFAVGGAVGFRSLTKAVTSTNNTYINNSVTAGLFAGGAVSYELNSAASSFLSTGDIFTNNRSGLGGAFYASNSNLGSVEFDNATFTGNLANVSSALGGAIYMNAGSSLTIKGVGLNPDNTPKMSLFQNNFATNSGGAVYVQDTSTLVVNVDYAKFISNTTTDVSGNGGGAIRALNIGDMTVTNSTFTSNQSRIGGGIFVERTTGAGGQVTLTGNTFDSNIGFAIGGAVSLRSLTKAVNSLNNTYMNNSVTAGLFSGGAISYESGTSSFLSTGDTFTNNRSRLGGAFFAGGTIANAATIEFNNATFSGNLANVGSGQGGAINIVSGPKLTVKNSNFQNNSATNSGGAIYAIDASTMILEISNSAFTNNTVTASGSDGGAVYAQDLGSMSITGSSFTSNTALDQGGAIYMSNVTGSAALTIGTGVVGGGNTFSSNSAAVGGAIFSTANTKALNYTNNTFNSNSATDTTDAIGIGGGAINLTSEGSGASFLSTSNTFTGNTASRGGAVNSTSNISLTFSGDKFGTTASNGNQAAQIGGALFVSTTNASTVTVNNASSFVGNQAGNGGGLYLENSKLVISNSLFEDNAADSSGGAVFSDHANTVTINDSTFSGNNAYAGGGGAVLLRGTTSTININNSTFLGNSAIYGGGLRLENNNSVFLNNDHFESNIENGGSGGAISSYHNINFQVDDSSFVNNSASAGGGAIETDADDSVLIQNSVFSGNTTNGLNGGGAIRSAGQDKTVLISNNIFTDNSIAGSGLGGAISFAADSSITLTITDNTFTHNSASSGGAINIRNTLPDWFFINEYIIRIESNTFTENTRGAVNIRQTFDVGGASSTIDLNDNTFDNNNSIGSTVVLNLRYNEEFEYSGNATVNINNSIFTNNTGSSSFNGASILSITNDSVFDNYFNINNSVFSNNSVALGVISATGNPTLTISHSTFSNNSGPRVVSVNGEATLRIDHSTFSDNSGVALYATDLSTFTFVPLVIDSSTFSGHHNLTTDGGAIQLVGNGTHGNYNALIVNSIFENNSSVGTGGAIYSDTITVLIDNTFTDNHAGLEGGAVALLGLDIGLQGNTFTGNSADDNGGALWVQSTPSSRPVILDNTFLNNSAGNAGGAVYLVHSEKIATIEGNTFTGNTAIGNGGAIFAQDNVAGIDIINNQFNSNSGSSGAVYLSLNDGALTIDSNIFTGNIGNAGAAIASDRNWELIVSNNQFTNNISWWLGGALFIQINDSVSLFDNTFTGNSASSLGGAILLLYNRIVTSDHDTFINNGAYQGGAIFAIGNQSLSISYDSFGDYASNGNHADRGGGIYLGSDWFGQYLPNGTVTVANSVFAKNSATGDGSAIYAVDVGHLNVISNTIYLGAGNGAIATYGSTLAYISQNSIYSNGGLGIAVNSNNEQQAPVITSGSYDLSQNLYTISGYLTSAIGTYTLEFFANSGPGIGEGQTYLGSAIVTVTNANVNTPYTVSFSNVAVPYSVTATVTNSVHNTSEFSQPVNLLPQSFQQIYVNQLTGSDSNSGMDWQHSFQTMQKALSVAGMSGQTEMIFVAEGTYTGNFSISNYGNLVYILGGFDDSGNGVRNVDANVTTLTGPSGASIVSINSASIVMDGFTISGGNNSNGNGGGIFAGSGSTVIISHDTFTNNTAIQGGAIYANGGSLLTVGTSSFVGNSAHDGGAVYAESIPSLTIDNTIFINNTASNEGGALALKGISSVTMSNDAFSGNSARDGGALYAESNLTVAVNDAIFISNSASNDGGAIALSGDQTVTLVKNIFFPNSALNNGGAIFVDGGHLTLSYNTFSGNTANNQGGAIFSDSSSLSIDHSSFDHNNAGVSSSAIRVNSGTLTISDSTFTSHTSVLGGAIGSYNAQVNIANSYFDSNSASVDGGALWITGGSTTITNSTFIGNSVSNFTEEHVNAGGAIFISGVNLMISGSNFINNFALDAGAIFSENGSSISIDHSYFDHNLGAFSGTISANFGTLSINASTFTNNKGFQRAGAVFMDHGQFVSITSSTFSYNTSEVAGAIYLSHIQQQVVIDNSHFDHNFTEPGDTGAIGDGGALLIVGGSTAISNSTFTNNTAAGNGGAIKVNDGQLLISSNTFTNNTANINGGAIKINDGQLLITSSNFSFNRSRLGGAINSTNTQLIIDNSDFEGNSIISNVFQNVKAGAIFAEESPITISNSTFNGNFADVASALYAIDSSHLRTLNISQSTFSNNFNDFGEGVFIALGFGSMSVTDSDFTSNYIGALIVQDVGDLSITGSSFIGNAGGDGGAVQVVEADTVFISGSIFTGNASAHGGAIYVQDSGDVSITDSSFTYNISGAGGAIFAMIPEGLLTIENSIFDGNEAYAGPGGAIMVSYGALIVDNSEFTGNSCTGSVLASRAGGAIALHDNIGDIIIIDSNFIGNRAYKGAAVYGFAGAYDDTVYFINNIFDGNIADGHGGAFTGSEMNKALVSINNIYENNEAHGVIGQVNNTGTGGALALYNQNVFTSIGDLFKNNVAGIGLPGLGGAIMIQQDYLQGLPLAITINNSTFLGNSATNGGAIFAIGRANGISSIVNVVNSDFINNTAPQGGSGGAIYGVKLDELNVSGSHFSGNSANNGWGGAIVSDTNKKMTVDQSVFEGNIAGRDGGAVMVFNTSTGKVLNSTFTGNSSGSSGGAIYAEGSTTMVNVIGNTIVNNEAVFGGGIATRAGANALISQNSIYNNDGLGIDINSDGVSLNDSGDANAIQNYPVITNVTYSGGAYHITGMINTKPGTYTIEFFGSESIDPSGNGEGQIYIGSGTVTVTSSSGNTPFTFDIVSSIPLPSYMTTTATSSSGHTSEFSQGLDLVATAPNLSTFNASGIEDNGAIALNIASSLNDTDGSESLTIYITGVPTGAALNHGTYSSGVWQLTPADLSGLTLTMPANGSGDFNLTVTATATESMTGDMKSTISIMGLHVEAVADTPNLSTGPASGVEDGGAIPLNITSSLNDSDGSETLSISISGVPTGATLNHGTYSSGVWQLTTADLSGLTLTMPANGSGDFNLTVTATATESMTGDMKSTSSTLGLHVAAVADTPNLTTGPASGVEDGGAIPLNITSSLNDTDGSEALSISIGGVPTGATLNHGTYSSGVWQLTTADLSGLTLTMPANGSGDFNLTVTATATESMTGDMKSTISTLGVHVEAVADTPNLTVMNAVGNEDTAIALNIGASLNDLDGSETLMIDITGVPTGAMLSKGLDLGGGHWQLTPAQLSGLTITPASNSGDDFTLCVKAIATDGTSTAKATGSVVVDVTPVADTPSLTVANSSGLDHVAIPLSISSMLTDRDGSESLTITISGVPAGAVLSNGFVNQGGGIWTLSGLTPANDMTALNGLTITTPLTFDGPFSLTVTARSVEAMNGDAATRSANIDILVKPRLWGIDKADNQLFSIGDYANPGSTFTDFGTLQYGGQAISGSIESFALQGTSGYFVINSFNAPGSSLNGRDVLAKIDITQMVAGGPNNVTILGEVNVPIGHRISGLAINPLTGDLFAVQKRGNDTGQGQDSLLVISKVDGHILTDVGKMMGLNEKSSVTDDIKFDHCGNLYVTDNYDDKTYKISATNGSIIAVVDNNQSGGIGHSVSITAMASDSYANMMIALDDNADALLAGITGDNGGNSVISSLAGLGLTSIGGMDFSQ